MIQVDLEQRSISGGIRELAESRRDGPRGAGLLSRMRAELGQRVHADYRREQQGRTPAYLAERGLELRCEVDGFRTRLRGRVDGWLERGRETLIEEIKSVTLPGGQLERAREELFPEYCLQLRLYGLAAMRAQPERRFVLRLVLVSLLDGGRRSIDLAPHPEATEALLVELLREWIARARSDRAESARRAALADRLVLPYPARPYQRDLIQSFADGLEAGRPVLATAPTGIGKTVAALLAGLRHALRNGAGMLFATAKNTQQELVGQTFEDLCRASGLRAGELRSLTLRAKERMCPPGHGLCHPELCEFMADFDSRLVRSGALEQLGEGVFRILPEAVLAAGEAHRLCPFYLQLAALPSVGLVIGDANYAYDPAASLSELFGEGAARQAVVVVDEAHNLVDRMREVYSPWIGRQALAGLDARLASGEFLASSEDAQQLDLGLGGPVRGPALTGQIRELIAAVDRAVLEAMQQAESDGSPRIEACCSLEPDRQAWLSLASRAEPLLVAYLLYNRAHRLVHPQDPILDLCGRLLRLRDELVPGEREFVPFCSSREAPQGEGFGVLCVNPARRLAACHRRAAGTIAMSATLTPLPYYADVLGFAELGPLQVALPSPFPRENLAVFVEDSVSTAFRDRDRHHARVARIIETVVQARPGNYAAFFPSFQYLAAVRARIALPAEQVLIQLPSMSESSRGRMLGALRAADRPRLLLAVMGGIFAEGVDLPGAQLIGAVVVGPGLPQVGFERAAMQLYFDEEYEQGFAYAMLYPGLQRVIQSAGRVIRGPDDRGVIVLVGRRFADSELAACLPEHWYRFRPEEMRTEDLAADLASFWSQGPMPEAEKIIQ
ncbi:MAG: ATP-dependent DNA helicase [Deltaproteobacteria bacterium]|nr:ATP-dependent DNA helicase [Deltaproteobacteria bacterium]